MISAIDLAKLRNGEFLQFMLGFSALVENNNPALLNILQQHSNLQLIISEIEPLFKLERVNAITQQLVLLDERRDKAITGLSTVIDGYCCHFKVSIAQAAKLLSTDLQLFYSEIAKQNHQAETTLINRIVSNWETKPELTAALVILDLEEWKEELKTANQIFNQKYIERIQEYGVENSDLLNAKKEEALIVYFELKKHLEAYSVINNNPVFPQTIKQLNALIEQYNALLKSRLRGPNTKHTPVAN